MSRSVIVSGARTPIGKFRGAFAGMSAVDLGAVAIREALVRSGVAPGTQVDYVVMGQVIRAGTGQITARQAAIAAGIPKEVPALNVDKVCLSGTTAIALADQLIRAGEVDVVVAGGMESMTQAPYVLPAAREGSRLGHAEMVDSMIHDGLWSTFTKQTMGESSDAGERRARHRPRGAGRLGGAIAPARGRRRGTSGALAEEVVPVEVPQRKGDAVVVERDEGIRADSTPEALAGLKPAFGESGTITAGNASQISDGAPRSS